MRKKLSILVLVGVVLTIGAPAWAAPAAPLTPHTFNVTLVPSGDPDGSGRAVVTVDLRSGTMCYDITVTGIGEPTEPVAGIGSAHIHESPSGAIAVDLDAEFDLVTGPSDTYAAQDCVTVRNRSELVEILLNPDEYYVNVHTVEDPGGAVQGFLG